jgi:hypothetical protein
VKPHRNDAAAVRSEGGRPTDSIAEFYDCDIQHDAIRLRGGWLGNAKANLPLGKAALARELRLGRLPEAGRWPRGESRSTPCLHPNVERDSAGVELALNLFRPIHHRQDGYQSPRREALRSFIGSSQRVRRGLSTASKVRCASSVSLLIYIGYILQPGLVAGYAQQRKSLFGF